MKIKNYSRGACPFVFGLLLAIVCTGCGAIDRHQSGTSALDLYRAAEVDAGQGKCNDAQPLYSAAIRGDSHFVSAFLGQANCAKQEGDLKTAVDSYSQAIAIDGANYRLYLGRGSVESSEGDMGRAASDLQMALKLAPPQVPTYAEIAQVFADQGDYPGAVAVIARAIRLDSKRSDLYRTRASYYLASQDFRDAESDCRAALVTSPDDSSRALAYSEGAAVYQQAGEYSLAVLAIEHALVLSKNNAAYYQEAGSIYTSAQRFLDAIRAYNQAIRYLPDRGAAAQLRMTIGDLYEKTGDRGDARGQYALARSMSNDKSFKQTAQTKMDALNNN